MTLTPTTLGNIMVVSVGNNYGLFGSAIILTGGGVTTWNDLITWNDVNGSNAALRWGVITATGSQTLTVSTFGNSVSAIAQEFSTSGTVSGDTTNGATSTSTSGNFPPVTPSGAGELYLATLFGDTPLGGSEAGFTYVAGAANPFAGVSEFVYGIGPTGATSPPWTSGGTTYVDGRYQCAGFLQETTLPTSQIIMVL